MSSLNKVQLIGNLGNDPDIINEGKIAKFSLATSESWKDKASGERKTKTEWHNIVVYNEGLVGVVQQYVKKVLRYMLRVSCKLVNGKIKMV